MKRISRIYYLTAILLYIGIITGCKKKSHATLAVLTTAVPSNITAISATSGGTINSDGGATVTGRGVCWSTTNNPTTGLSTKSDDGSGTGSFSSNLTGLSGGATYYVRSYAINSAGTAYGNELQFNTPLAIGQNYGGGKIFFIDGTGQHGLIAVLSDMNSTATWYNGNYVTTNATSLTNGSGNTITIITSQGNTGDYAAKLCRDYNGGGFNDWFLPSKDQLNTLYLQKAAIGNLIDNSYWCSTEFDNLHAWYQYFGNGFQNYAFKNSFNYIRPIRAF